MTITPNPTAELRRHRTPIEDCRRPRPEDTARPDPSRPTRNPPDPEVHADVGAVVRGWVEARKSLVVSTVAGPTHSTGQMNPASRCSPESHAPVEVSGREVDAGYTQDSPTGTGFWASRVPGSIQRGSELCSRAPTGALAPLTPQAGRAAA